MNDSSFIISPVNADFSDVWSEPELLSAEGHNALYVATRFGRKYVLKALAESYRESTPHIELLRKEFAIGVGVDHPNIVRLLDFGRMDSIGWYIRMEYIDGITLDQFLETMPSTAVRRKLISQLLDALSFLHERQIIHRDIKPSNILITRNGTTIKLIDFGVSDTDDYVTFKQPAGSISYIAPEQLAGKPIDNRADIYAVGKIIQLLFPHRYRLIARRCTRVDAARRYPSCARITRALKRADNLRMWLPLSLILLLIPCAAVWGIYTGYQQSERMHNEQETQLFIQVDSLRAQDERHEERVDSLRVQNIERQQQVDSLNRVVDSLAIKANTPTQEEILDLKVKEIYQDYISRTEEAIKAQDIVSLVDTHPTPAEQWSQGMTELFASVGDNEELRLHILQANGRYYAMLYMPFMNRMANPLSQIVRSEADYKALKLEQFF